MITDTTDYQQLALEDRKLTITLDCLPSNGGCGRTFTIPREVKPGAILTCPNCRCQHTLTAAMVHMTQITNSHPYH